MRRSEKSSAAPAGSTRNAKTGSAPNARVDLGLHATLAVAVAVSTRALGALPVFAFLVLPAGAALLFSERLKVVLVLSVLFSMVSAAVGYWLSWTWSLPTGPVMVALAAGFWALGGLKRLAEGRA